MANIFKTIVIVARGLEPDPRIVKAIDASPNQTSLRAWHVRGWL
jgi:hypothetical protein